MRGRLVCLTGIDGSGKTTLAKAVVSRLSEDGRNSVYVYGKHVPIITRAMVYAANRITLREYDIDQDYRRYSARKQGLTKKYPRISGLYRAALLVEYSIGVMIRLWPELLRNRIVVCDRYVYDTLISDFAVDFNMKPERILREIALLLRILPRPDAVFLLEVPLEVAISRKDDVASSDFLADRESIYRGIATALRFTPLDGTKPIAELSESVVTQLAAGLCQ